MGRSLRRLAALLSRRQRWQGVLLVVLLIGNALIEMVGVGLVPVYIGILAEPDRLLHSERVAAGIALLGWSPEFLNQRTLLYGGSALLLGLFTLKLVYAPLLAYLRARYIQGVVKSLSIRLFQGYLHAPYSFHLRRNSAELIRNINAECTQLGNNLLNPLANLVSQLLITVGIVALLIASISGVALLALLVFAVLVLPWVALLTRRIKRLALQAQAGRRSVIGAVQEGLGGVKELRLLRRESFFVRRFQAALQQVLDLQRFLQVQSISVPVFMEWFAVAGLLLVIVILFGAGPSPESLLGMVALFAVGVARLKGSVAGLFGAYTQVRSSVVSVDVIDHDLCHLAQIQPRPPVAMERPARLQGAESIHLDAVWFRYAGCEESVLRDINLTIRRGEAMGLVGPSGSGKSTLVDVILGILEPERGSVQVDGVDIRRDLPGWRRTLGYIPQSIFLIDGTIRQNIALGLEDQDIDDAAVEQAMVAAHLDEFVKGLPEGVNTMIGERGVRLSGGQRQRVAIARALYHNPQVLIMDEATSALDNVTEKAVMEAVDSLKGQRTILMIAHRLNTVRNCDRIVFLQAGEISRIGTYDELATSHIQFRRMADAC
jgi:ATP-binding cassette subfamily C protein